jgi:hypothetical protein
MTSIPDESQSKSTEQERRSFLGRAAAILAGSIAVVFPFAAGSGVLFDPLRRRRQSAAGDAD